MRGSTPAAQSRPISPHLPRSMDSCAYKAAMSPEADIQISQFEAALCDTTPGKKNTLLHLAAGAGNLRFVNQILEHRNVNPEFVHSLNVNGNTALHEAAQGGYCNVVEALLKKHSGLANILNFSRESALFKACEGGHLTTVFNVLPLTDRSALTQKTSDGRTCLHAVVIGGHADLLERLLRYSKHKFEKELKDLINAVDEHGNTVLHLAVRRNRVDMVRKLVHWKTEAGYFFNSSGHSPLFIAVNLGFLEIVKELIKISPETIEIRDKRGRNVLHLAVEARQVRIVKFLTEEVNLSQLVNEPDYQVPPLQSIPMESGGNTPLHIAASNKDLHMVELLLSVRGVKKDAVNKGGLTPLDIARGNTEYYESYDLIGRLASFHPGQVPFLYNAPNVSQQKYDRSMQMMEATFAQRQGSELVVAVLLATIAFTSVFTVPGGFDTENTKKEYLGSPILFGYDSFKLFLFFDCVAFSLSLLVVLMWEMNFPLTKVDKMLFMSITNSLVCTAFAFAAYGFMAAVYSMLAHRSANLASLFLGTFMVICLLGNIVVFYMAIKLTVKRVRVQLLCGVPRLENMVVEYIWTWAENWGLLDIVRRLSRTFRPSFTGYRLRHHHNRLRSNAMGVMHPNGHESQTPDIYAYTRNDSYAP